MLIYDLILHWKWKQTNYTFKNENVYCVDEVIINILFTLLIPKALRPKTLNFYYY